MTTKIPADRGKKVSAGIGEMSGAELFPSNPNGFATSLYEGGLGMAASFSSSPEAPS